MPPLQRLKSQLQFLSLFVSAGRGQRKTQPLQQQQSQRSVYGAGRRWIHGFNCQEDDGKTRGNCLYTGSQHTSTDMSTVLVTPPNSCQTRSKWSGACRTARKVTTDQKKEYTSLPTTGSLRAHHKWPEGQGGRGGHNTTDKGEGAHQHSG